MRRRVGAAALLVIGAAVPVASADPTAIPEVPSSPGMTFEDDPGIVDAHPLLPQSWSRLDPAPELALNFQLGSPDCYGVHATVRDTDDAVLISLLAGNRRQGSMVCTMIIMHGKLVVPLDNPVGGRAVLIAE